MERTAEEIKGYVQQHYGAIAAEVLEQLPVVSPLLLPMAQENCCGPALLDRQAITEALYGVDDVSELPPAVVLSSHGCGNPTALAELKAGETVLDLGSGGGIDVLLSARRVGAIGFAYGLDMTDEMLELARRNAAEACVPNVAFLKGEMEAVPLPDASVDVVISNCVINLSADKGRVIREAFRVLRPGGRFAVSDIVVQGQLHPAVQQSLELWAGCYAGALEQNEYLSLLQAAGFGEAGIEVTRELTLPAGKLPEGVQQSPEEGRFVSAFVRATKPA